MAFDITKIIDIVKDPDLKIKINDLYGENLKLKEENFDLKRKLEKLKETTDIKSRLIPENNHYFLTEGDKKDGPYCTNCWDANSKLVRLHKGGYHSGVQYYTCPNCKTTTTTGSHIRSEDNGGTNWSY